MELRNVTIKFNSSLKCATISKELLKSIESLENENPTEKGYINFRDKTIKKISLENGKFVTTQSEILDHVKLYYQNLFKSRDNSLSNADLDRLLKNIPINKLEEKDNCLLEGSLTISELGEALKT